MRVFSRLGHDPVCTRVLAQESTEPIVLPQQTCLRCQYRWWPRRPTKPQRCAKCKSPYWDRPRRLKQSRPAGLTPLRPEELKASLRTMLEEAFERVNSEPAGSADRSLGKALEVLRDMKAAGRTWTEMADRVERDFGTKLDKDQLKALVR